MLSRLVAIMLSVFMHLALAGLVEAAPDLVTQNLMRSPTSGPAGSVVRVTGTIRNQGNATASASTTNLRLSASPTTHPTTGDPLLAQISVPSLAVNATFPIDVNVTIPAGTPAGTRYIWVILDINSSAGQGSANEANDWSNVSFTVTPPPTFSDLVTLNLARNPTSGPANSVVRVTGTIRNQGNAAASASTTNVRLSTSPTNHPTTGDPLLAQISVPSLAVNATFPIDVNVTIPAGTPVSTRYIWVILDVNSSAGQGSANELNDWSNVSFTVTPPPTFSDLITQSLACNPTSGPAGSVVRVTGTIRNQGNATASASTTNLRLSTSSTTHPTASDPLLAQINVPSLAVNATFPIDVNVTIPSGTPAGTRYIWVILDINSSAGQGSANEANDWSNVSYTVSTELGACCVGGTNCTIGITQSACLSQSGVWQAGATNCSNCLPGSATFAEVVPNPLGSIGQQYAAYNVGYPNHFHAGMDLDAAYGTAARAAHGGVVHKVFGLSTLGSNPMPCGTATNLRRWNTSTNVYSWQPQPLLDRLGQPYQPNNHGLGQCVIIWHETLRLYTLYGHLDSVAEGLVPGTLVTAGQPIGQVGNSHYGWLRHCLAGGSGCTTPAGSVPGGCSSWSQLAPAPNGTGFNPHVHFEVKHFGNLGSVSDDDCPANPCIPSPSCICWGYVPGTQGQGGPNLYGYVNPHPFFDRQIQITPMSPTGVSPTGNQSARTGPDSSYSLPVTNVTSNQRFVAFAQHNSWYQVFLPSMSGPATGWIQAAPDSSTVLLEVNDSVQRENGVPVQQSASTASPLASKVWNRQWHVRPSAPSSGTGCSLSWHQVHLATNAPSSLGWACGDFLIVHGLPTCYANCDGSTITPLLTANDFICFINRFAAGEAYANCDGSGIAPVLTANDFMCFLNRYAAGCP